MMSALSAAAPLGLAGNFFRARVDLWVRSVRWGGRGSVKNNDAHMAVTKSLNGMSFSPDMPRLQHNEQKQACTHAAVQRKQAPNRSKVAMHMHATHHVRGLNKHEIRVAA